MKKLISVILSGAMLASCATYQFTDLQITGAATLAARGALAVVPSANKAAVKNYMFYIATTVRTLSGDATPQQLSDLLLNSLPPDVKAQYPELVSVIIPAVVDVYSTFYNQFQTDHTKLLKILNDIATGIEAAASVN